MAKRIYLYTPDIRICPGYTYIPRICTFSITTTLASCPFVPQCLSRSTPAPVSRTPAPVPSYPGTSLFVPRHQSLRTPAPVPSYPGTSPFVPRHLKPHTPTQILLYPGTNSLVQGSFLMGTRGVRGYEGIIRVIPGYDTRVFRRIPGYEGQGIPGYEGAGWDTVCFCVCFSTNSTACTNY